MLTLRLRRVLWLSNAVLSAGVIGVGFAISRPSPGVPPTPDACPLDVQWASAAGPPISRIVSEREFLRLRASLGEVHARTSPVIGLAPVADEPQGPLPLRLLRVVGLYHDTAGVDVVGLASKDPARPENFALGRNESVHGARLVSVELGSGPARVTVARGAEEFTYTFVRASDTASVTVLVLDPGTAAVVAAAGHGSRPTAPPSTGAGLRLVGYLGPDGVLAGVRVTGIEPASAFAAAGVRRGDAILEFDGQRIDSASAFSKRWSEGWRPMEALVLATEQPGAKPTRIKFGS